MKDGEEMVESTVMVGGGLMRCRVSSNDLPSSSITVACHNHHEFLCLSRDMYLCCTNVLYIQALPLFHSFKTEGFFVCNQDLSC